MKRILMIATGGTIACKRSDAGLTPVLTSQELLSYVPAAKDFCSVDTLQLMNIDSTNMEANHWLAIARAVENNYSNYDGFVITHGTDTMAYTAAALSYLVQNSIKPVIITGAQKPIDLDVTDARTNLIDSLRIASDSRAYGVNIVFDGKVICGTRAKRNARTATMHFQALTFLTLRLCRMNGVFFILMTKRKMRLNFSYA